MKDEIDVGIYTSKTPNREKCVMCGGVADWEVVHDNYTSGYCNKCTGGNMEQTKNERTDTDGKTWTWDTTSSWSMPVPAPASLMAEEHVDWFLQIVRPMLISYFEHGYKHGKESKDG